MPEASEPLAGGRASLASEHRSHEVRTLQSGPESSPLAEWVCYGTAPLLRPVQGRGSSLNPRLLAWMPPASRSSGDRISPELCWAQKDPVGALEAALARGVPLDATTRREGVPPLFYSGEDSLLQTALSADAPKAVGWLRKLPQSAERDRLLAAAFGTAPPGLGRDIFRELSPEQQANTADWLAQRIASVDSGGRDALGAGVATRPGAIGSHHGRDVVLCAQIPDQNRGAHQ